MTDLVVLNKNIKEDLRQEYLSALGITEWLPKDFQELHSIENTPVIPATDTQPSNSPNSLELSRDSAELIQASALDSVTANESSITETNSINKPIEADIDSAVVVTDQSKAADKVTHYLKLVNWSNPVLSEASAKRLLVICRHQTDQPANSFARANSPSQFMMDYINALNALCASQNIEYRIQLAHLSAAGLGDECVTLDSVMSSDSPDAILLLGDETVSHLLNSTDTIASTRGHTHTIQAVSSVMVSYHPYTLIKNPSLKRLAYEDLVFASEFLHQMQ